jgi:imidazolonepropionase
MFQIGFRNIEKLITNDSDSLYELAEISNAAFAVSDGKIAWVGKSSELPPCETFVDLAGSAVLPGFVDSHAHLIFAGNRAEEFSARMQGNAYTAGGIKSTVSATRAASDDQLRANIRQLASEMLAAGITTFETKTGYGLTTQDEIRALKIALEFTDEVTLLAAHVVPSEYSGTPDAYVDLIIDEMIPAAVGLAKWFDVFCEKGAFTDAQTERLLTAAQSAGLKLRLHANQLTEGAGMEIAAKFGVASADHCSHFTDLDIAAVKTAGVVVTLLPGAEFSTRASYPDAQRLIDAGVTVAIATDCNPGSSYTTSMPLMIALAVREMRMSPAEAIWAATKGGASALLRNDVGVIRAGAKADFIVLNSAEPIDLAYRPGVDLVKQVWRAGELLVDKGWQR